MPLEGGKPALRRDGEMPTVADGADARWDFRWLVGDGAHDAAGERKRHVQYDGADAAADLGHSRRPGSVGRMHDEVLHRGGGAGAYDEAAGTEDSTVCGAQVAVCYSFRENVHPSLGGGLHYGSRNHCPVVGSWSALVDASRQEWTESAHESDDQSCNEVVSILEQMMEDCVPAKLTTRRGGLAVMAILRPSLKRRIEKEVERYGCK